MKLEDTMFLDGLTDTFKGYTMGITAENIASKMEISRQDQDQYAIDSHEKALNAQKCGHFNSEICETQEQQTDEQPRLQDATRLAKQKPYWRTDGQGSVTPGNASTLNDGAAAILLCSQTVVSSKAL